MTRYRLLMPTGLLSAALFIMTSLAMPATGFASANDRYRVELIVFRNLDTVAEPDQVQHIRRFFDAFELGDAAAPPVPLALEKTDGSFASIWTRLERLADYEPLLRLTFEQTMFDYHPAVRVHNEEVMGRELHFPADIVYLDLASYPPAEPNDPDPPGVDLFATYMQPLYQLDGTLRMRRSRFLHLDLDLEYRLPGPAWDREFDRLKPGFEWVGNAPAIDATDVPDMPVVPAQVIVNDAAHVVLDPALEPPLAEPFDLYRLQQSRQIKSNTLQYFDSAFLGAIVRVTPIAAEAP